MGRWSLEAARLVEWVGESSGLLEGETCQLGKGRMTQRNGAGLHFFLCCKWIINVTFSRADKTEMMQFWA